MSEKYTAVIGEQNTNFVNTGDFYAQFTPVTVTDNLTSEQWQLLGGIYKHSVVVKINNVMRLKNRRFTDNRELVNWVKRNLIFILAV